MLHLKKPSKSLNEKSLKIISYLFLGQQVNMYHFGLDRNQGQGFKSQTPSVAEVILKREKYPDHWRKVASRVRTYN